MCTDLSQFCSAKASDPRALTPLSAHFLNVIQVRTSKKTLGRSVNIETEPYSGLQWAADVTSPCVGGEFYFYQIKNLV